MFALDTNTLIYFFLEVGIAQSSQPAKRRAQLDALLAAVAILPFDSAAAKRAAEVSSTLQRKGTMIGPMDNLVAGTALAHGATLVTHNTAEFR